MNREICSKCGRGFGKHYVGCSLNPVIAYLKKIGATPIGTLRPGESKEVIIVPRKEG